MLRSSARKGDRGQTEPLAALFAVAAIALAVGIYGGFVTDVLDSGSDRSVAEPTLERVWFEIGSDGIYENGTLSDDLVELEDLPEGRHVYINVTTVKDHRRTEIGEISYDATGSINTTPADPPEVGDHASRPIAIRFERGFVRGGRLTVVVWQQ